MRSLIKLVLVNFFSLLLFSTSISFSQDQEVGEILENIQVVPNPYVAHSNYNETEYLRKIRFINLPETCSITIYTISGEKVHSLKHDNINDGNAWWDLRTINNQEISPGLYLFSVETENDKYIGKFETTLKINRLFSLS